MARPKNDGRGRIGGRKKGTLNKPATERLIDKYIKELSKNTLEPYEAYFYSQTILYLYKIQLLQQSNNK